MSKPAAICTTVDDLDVKLVAEGDGWVITCDNPPVASQGDSIKEALDNIREAAGLYRDMQREA